MPQLKTIDLNEIKKLYTNYLKELCPDWSEKRINTEIETVIEEQGLSKSEQRRREFYESIVKKLESIRSHPDDWFFMDNGFI